MLEIPVRKLRSLGLTITFSGVAIFFSSCASDKPRTALISDPDAKRESSIPWNKPQKWESGANVPGGLGGVGGGFNGGGDSN